MNTSPVQLLPNPQSAFPNGHAIVSDVELPTYAGHRHGADDPFPGKWVYPFPGEPGARRALDRILVTLNDRHTSAK